LEPLREDVVVWADGRIETRFDTAGVLSGWKEFAPQRKRIVLSPAQMDQLFVLLSEVDFLRGEPVDPRIAGCAVQPREPDLVREVILGYSPRPGLRRELRRSWGGRLPGCDRVHPRVLRPPGAAGSLLRGAAPPYR